MVHFKRNAKDCHKFLRQKQDSSLFNDVRKGLLSPNMSFAHQPFLSFITFNFIIETTKIHHGKPSSITTTILSSYHQNQVSKETCKNPK
ncbi:hypothetical protein Hanom_Chr06g00538061 [Helianthus anomalus]